ncbi:MAG: efflux transporter outer membrane subunit [Akkermansiaceae bacterium]
MLQRIACPPSMIGLAMMMCLSACVNQPDALAPSAGKSLPLPERYDGTAYPTPAVASGLKNIFGSHSLNKWINIALKNNPDLKVSAARLSEAGFNTRKAYAPKLPEISLTANASRARSNPFGTPLLLSNHAANLDVSWELDVWGRVSAGLSAAASTQAAAQADYLAARQSIAAQTAQAYFELVAAEQRLALSERRLSSFQKTYKLVNRRFEGGTGNLGDTDLAKTDVDNTRAQVEQRKDTRDQAVRRLRALAGSYPSKSSVRGSKNWPSLTRGVSSGVPSGLLMRRPDIDAAFQRIRAADAQAKVAHRDLFPRFNLTSSAGRQSGVLNRLTDPNYNVWSIAGGITQPLFDAGNRRAELGAANARARQAYASYQSTVITAFREVENALGSEYYLKRQESALRQALTSARRAEDRVQSSYERGLVEILSLLDAQRRSFNTEESLIDTRALRYQNRVTLALAVGKAL